MMAELLSLVPAKSLETDVVVGEAPAVCPLPPVTVSNDTLLISLIDRLRRTLENLKVLSEKSFRFLSRQ